MSLKQELRHYIYQSFVNTSNAPSFLQILSHFDEPEEKIIKNLKSLEEEHLIVLQPHSNRVLMAHPFSNIGTSFIVTDIAYRREYFANCAWDAIAFYFMIGKPIRVDGFCRDTLENFSIEIIELDDITTSHPEFIVFLTKPAKTWWDNIYDTCSNHIHFFSSEQGAIDWAEERGIEGYALTKKQLFGLSEFLYKDKLNKDYQRPSKAEMVKIFKELDLKGDFWEI